MIRLIVDRAGRLLAVEGDGPRGVVWPVGSVSLNRFVEGVNQEFPELTVEVRK